MMVAPNRSEGCGVLPFVGRSREMALLEARLDCGGDGRSIVVVSGDGGVGKSRLAFELGTSAAGRGWEVVSGQAFPVEADVPLGLFSDAFVPLLREADPRTLTVLTRGREAELQRLFPGLSAGGAVEQTGASDREASRTRLQWTFVEFLRSYAARRPVLSILEDLQWADEASLQFLHFLARHAVGAPIVIVCTYNHTQVDRNLPLARTLGSLLSLGVGDSLRLEPLTIRDIADLMVGTFGADAAAIRREAALLFRWTRGNPFFVEEILKVGWTAEQPRIPDSIRSAVMAQSRMLSADARAVCEWVAVARSYMPYALLHSVSERKEPGLLAALEELCTCGILMEREEEGAVVYDFVHPLARRAIYESLGQTRTKLLHAAVARSMKSLYGDRTVEHAEEVAHFLVRSDVPRLPARAVECLAAAGSDAPDSGDSFEPASAGDLGPEPSLGFASPPDLDPDPPRTSPEEARDIRKLTRREREVARLVARHKSNKAVGRELAIATRTVTTHLYNIYRKLGISSRFELVELAAGALPSPPDRHTRNRRPTDSAQAPRVCLEDPPSEDETGRHLVGHVMLPPPKGRFTPAKSGRPRS